MPTRAVRHGICRIGSAAFHLRARVAVSSEEAGLAARPQYGYEARCSSSGTVNDSQKAHLYN